MFVSGGISAPKNNPADEALRGLSVDSFLACKRWLKGPDFLQRPEMDWPKPFETQPIASDDPEVKKDILVNVITHTEDATSKLMTYSSEWCTLKISVAWYLRLKSILLELSRKRKLILASLDPPGSSLEEKMREVRGAIGKHPLSVGELAEAESAIVHFSQQITFAEEISMLKGGASVLKKTSN